MVNCSTYMHVIQYTCSYIILYKIEDTLQWWQNPTLLFLAEVTWLSRFLTDYPFNCRFVCAKVTRMRTIAGTDEDILLGQDV